MADALALDLGMRAPDVVVEARVSGRARMQHVALCDGDTRWTVASAWPHPSFQGGFLPTARSVGDGGFSATYRLGNLALGKSLVAIRDPVQSATAPQAARGALGADVGTYEARVTLVQPVDLYSQVNRAVKYGFLFIGFTFLAFLLFDIVGGARVAAAEYLMTGAGLVLFFVLLLAFSEVIGFAWAYMLASAAIIGLLTAYSAAVLSSWRRARFIGALLLGRGLPLDLAVHLRMSEQALARRLPADERWTLPAYARYTTENTPEKIADLLVLADHPDRPAVQR